MNKKKKICMVGDFALGKTSLTQKFVNNVFSDKYLTTVGVKIDTAELNGTKLVVWDVAGRDSLSPINANYLVGAAGIVMVADGSRPETLTGLAGLWQTVQERIGDVPAVVAINKVDLPEWQVSTEILKECQGQGWDCFNTSAKNGQKIAELFERLLEKMNSAE